MKMLINGKKVDARDKETIAVTNPADGEILDTVPAAGRERNFSHAERKNI